MLMYSYVCNIVKGAFTTYDMATITCIVVILPAVPDLLSLHTMMGATL